LSAALKHFGAQSKGSYYFIVDMLFSIALEWSGSKLNLLMAKLFSM